MRKGCQEIHRTPFWTKEDFHSFIKAFLRNKYLVQIFIKQEALKPGFVLRVAKPSLHYTTKVQLESQNVKEAELDGDDN